MRILFFQGFVSPDMEHEASDAIGYGITSAEAIVAGLSARGVDVVPVQPPSPPSLDQERRRLSWILNGYRALLDLDLQAFDLIFIFHSLHQFPAEVRRILFDLRISVPVIGYSHGSHWDPTDTFRFIHYPDMEVVDLANLLSLDRVLLPSEFAREVILEHVAAWQPEAARKLEAKLAVVGLPIDTHRLDRCRTEEEFERPTIVFNHSLIPSKQPELFAEVAARALEKHDVSVVVTRHIEDEKMAGLFRELQARFPGRLILGNTYPIDTYFRTLWKADLQVSTATHEHLGIATLEAMYAHTCCLLPNRCSYPETTGGYADILYSSTEELEEKLDYYLENRGAREKAAATLHERSLRYTPEEVASRLMDVFSGLKAG